jgi:hypothetical protein
MSATDRAGWEYHPGQAEVQDILGMTDDEAERALAELTEPVAFELELVPFEVFEARRELADAEMAEAFGPCGTECSHTEAVR